MGRTLMLGLSEAFLRGVEGRVAPDSIVAIEEPDLIRDRGLAGLPESLSCLAEIVPARYQQDDEFLAVAVAADARWSFEAVLPGIEYGVPPAAAVAAELGLPGAGPSAAAILSDKVALRATTSAAGILNPAWREIGGPADITAFAGGGPGVVKPANRQASLGVQLLDRTRPADAAAAWQRMLGAREPVQVGRALTSSYLVEQRLHGPEVSVEVLVDGGRIVFGNITAKSVLPGPCPVEVGHLVPAAVSAETRAALTADMVTLVGALGFGTGILHAEWILTAAGPALVECAGRCPGDRIMDLIDLAYGTQLRLALLELLAGGHPRMATEAVQRSVIRFLSAPPGIVSAVTGVTEAQALPGVVDLSLVVAEGSEVSAWASSWDRPGYVIVTGEDVAEVEARVAAAMRTVRIRTR